MNFSVAILTFSWSALSPYINGFEAYTVRSGDSLYSLASRYAVNLNRIVAANPGINVYNLQIGQKINIPFGSVVPTDISYSSDILYMNLSAFKTLFPFLEIGYIGSSELCGRIPYVRIGTGQKKVFYNASFHANEWITTSVLMKFIENFANAYVTDGNIYSYNAASVYSTASIYIVPMVNPDGVDLVTGAIRPGTETYNRAELIAREFPAIPFPQGWKANIYGVDLNLQFPANWERAREIKFAQGYTRPAPRDYVGTAPLTAAEAYYVYQFARAQDFRLILSYHTQGRVIYWQYLDYVPDQSYYIGTRFADSSGYVLEQTPYTSSFAGFKDWFIQEYNRPGYTVEAGIGVNPLPISQFDTIYRENEGILTLGAVLAP